MTRVRVILVSLAVIAGGAALIWVIMAYTPVRQLLPGALRGDLRAEYLDAAVRLDSLEVAAARNAAYLDNIVAIMQGDFNTACDTAVSRQTVPDSLLLASEGERRFVEQYREEERFNLSVLSPIAAEGMIFTSPVPSGVSLSARTASGVNVAAGREVPVAAIYRGTVVAVNTDADGLSTIVIQHPNDFLSVLGGLGDVFVAPGAHVAAGERLAHSSPHNPIVFEMWHSGTPLDPREYIAF